MIADTQHHVRSCNHLQQKRVKADASLCAMTVALKKKSTVMTRCLRFCGRSSSVDAAKRYHQLLNSIFWKTARPTLKKNVRRSLNFLAYDVYTALMEAAAFLDRYMRSTVPQRSARWNETVINLTMAHDALQREHGGEINARQLSIPQ